MKKYGAPEMEMMDFIIDKSITGILPSIGDGENPDIHNDDQFGNW